MPSPLVGPGLRSDSGDAVTTHRNVIIVGSGPAGYTAALYTARADPEPLVFEGSQYGGALMNTTEVENFPGFTDGIMGPDLMNQIRAQAERFGAELVSDDVVSVDLAGPVKTVRTLDGESTGRRRDPGHRLGLPPARAARRTSCPGTASPGVPPVTASSSATRTSWSSAAATPRWRRPPSSPGSPSRSPWSTGATRCEPAASWSTGPRPTRRSAGPGTPRSSTSTARAPSPGSGCATRSPARSATCPSAGLFIAIGHLPRSELVKGQLDLDDEGYVLTVEAPATRTNLEGVFAAGDVVDHVYRQADHRRRQRLPGGAGCRALPRAPATWPQLAHTAQLAEQHG